MAQAALQVRAAPAAGRAVPHSQAWPGRQQAGGQPDARGDAPCTAWRRPWCAQGWASGRRQWHHMHKGLPGQPAAGGPQLPLPVTSPPTALPGGSLASAASTGGSTSGAKHVYRLSARSSRDTAASRTSCKAWQRMQGRGQGRGRADGGQKCLDLRHLRRGVQSPTARRKQSWRAVPACSLACWRSAQRHQQGSAGHCKPSAGVPPQGTRRHAWQGMPRPAPTPCWEHNTTTTPQQHHNTPSTTPTE